MIRQKTKTDIRDKLPRHRGVRVCFFVWAGLWHLSGHWDLRDAADGWRQHQQGGWKESQATHGAGEDKFRNCTTLATKHPLPLDDRKDLLLGILSSLQTMMESADHQGSITPFPRAAVGAWSAVTVQATIYVLCRAPASLPLRTLRSPSGLYEASHASEVLFENVALLYPSAAARVSVREFLIQHCWASQDAIIERAVSLCFDPAEVQDKALTLCSRSDSRNGIPPSQFSQAARRLGGGSPVSGALAAAPRELRVMNSDEEMAHLAKRQKILEMRLSVQRKEAEALREEAQVAEGPSKSPQEACTVRVSL